MALTFYYKITSYFTFDKRNNSDEYFIIQTPSFQFGSLCLGWKRITTFNGVNTQCLSFTSFAEAESFLISKMSIDGNWSRKKNVLKFKKYIQTGFC